MSATNNTRIPKKEIHQKYAIVANIPLKVWPGAVVICGSYINKNLSLRLVRQPTEAQRSATISARGSHYYHH